MVKTFPASLDKLYEMLRFIREQASLAGFKFNHVSKIELAAEEALVNIISYGYINRLGYIDIICLSENEKAGITITIKDRGVAYNPLTNSRNFDLHAPLEARSIGGYGVFFIFKIMDEVEYKRDSNMNVLTMTKYV